MADDVPMGYYDGPADPAADAVLDRVRRDLAGHPKDEVFQTLDHGLRGAGVTPRLDAIEVLARELSYRPNVD